MPASASPARYQLPYFSPACSSIGRAEVSANLTSSREMSGLPSAEARSPAIFTAPESMRSLRVRPDFPSTSFAFLRANMSSSSIAPASACGILPSRAISCAKNCTSFILFSGVSGMYAFMRSS